jgi:hypothetical protein
MSIATGLSATKTGFDLIKSARELLTRSDVNPAEVQARLLELQALMLEAQRALGDAEEESRSLKREIEQLKEQASTATSLEFAETVYWRRDAKGQLDGPYCPTCWDDKRKLIRLKHADGIFGVNRDQRRYDCILHSTMYLVPDRTFGPSRLTR